MVVSHLPKALLDAAASTRITRDSLIALYSEQARVASAFESYNFRSYFLRRANNRLVNLPTSLGLPGPSANPPIPPPSTSEQAARFAEEFLPADFLANPNPATDAQLKEWYANELHDLAAQVRSVVVNRLYEAPKLVVETDK